MIEKVFVVNMALKYTPQLSYNLLSFANFFSLLLDWKGRDNLGLERAVRPGTLLIHLHTGQAC